MYEIGEVSFHLFCRNGFDLVAEIKGLLLPAHVWRKSRFVKLTRLPKEIHSSPAAARVLKLFGRISGDITLYRQNEGVLKHKTFQLF